MELSLQTPALLFSATSLILLAYTNRFLTLATLIRNLKAGNSDENKFIRGQISNLTLRVNLIRLMQLWGVISLFFSVFSMLVLYLNFTLIATLFFGLSLFCLLVSLGLSAYEIHISVKALQLHLRKFDQSEES